MSRAKSVSVACVAMLSLSIAPRVSAQEPAAIAAELVPAPVVAPPSSDSDDVEISMQLGRGVTITAGAAFSLQIRARLQFQAALTEWSAAARQAGAPDESLLELQIRRMRLVLAGHVLSRDVRYYIQLGFSPRDMEHDLLIPVRDAQLIWTAHRDLAIRVGQMKVPYGMQRIVSSSALQLVDRSSVTAELNLDRDIGITLFSDDFLGLDSLVQYALGVFGGRGRNRFGGLDSALLAARIQLNPLGPFDHLSEGDLSRTMQPRLSLGGSVAYNIGSNRARSTHGDTFEVGRFDYLHAGADVHFKWAGFSVLGELFYRDAQQRTATGIVDGEPVVEHSRSAWGWFVQSGYVLPWLPLEAAVRYGEVRALDNALEAPFAEQHELGGALSYYFEGHALKVQLDYFYYFGDDSRAERHQARAQAQLFF